MVSRHLLLAAPGEEERADQLLHVLLQERDRQQRQLVQELFDPQPLRLSAYVRQRVGVVGVQQVPRRVTSPSARVPPAGTVAAGIVTRGAFAGVERGGCRGRDPRRSSRHGARAGELGLGRSASGAGPGP